MDYRILGPVGVWVDGAEVRVGGPRERRALATLLLSAGQTVSVARLVDVLWGEDPPSTATTQIRNTLAALRRNIAGRNGGRAPIVRAAGGFVLRLEGAELDLHAFERAVSHAGVLAERGDLPTAADGLRQALRLWRGPALGGVATSALQAEAHRLEEQRFSCLQRCIEIDIALGRYQEAAAELTALVRQHPLREHLSGLLMVALYRAGRRQDALDEFAAARLRLADGAGLDPGPQLVGLQQAILRGEPFGDAVREALGYADPARVPGRPAPIGDAQPWPPIPDQLPTSVGDFVGRAAEINRMHALLTGPEPAPGADTIVSVAGMAGTGKTTVAVRAAHEVRKHFPDGCLFTDLRGTEPEPADPHAVLGTFLHAFGIPAETLPTDLAGRAALYRSVLAGRRVLVVLDNAASDRQLQPLLPGGGCAVIVTGRAGTDLPGARCLVLEPLPVDDCLTLLARVGGQHRVDAEPAAAQRVVELCGRLPLAIRVAAVRLSRRGTMTTATLADRLADERGRLDELVVADLDVRASLAVGYQRLDPAAVRLLGLTATLPFPTLAPWLAAALLDVPAPRAEQVMEGLLAANLLTPTGGGRYRLHDLVRLDAAERTSDTEPPASRRAAARRACEVLLDTARHANQRLPCRPVPLPGPAGAVPYPPADPVRWFDAERAALVAAVDVAVDVGLPDLAGHLATVLANACMMRGHHDDWARSHHRALAARDTGDPSLDPVVTARLYLNLANLDRIRDRNRAALPRLRRAYRLFRTSGDTAGMACAAVSWAVCALLLGNTRVARAATDIAGTLLGDAEDLPLAGYLALLRRGPLAASPAESHASLERALAIFDRLGERWGAAETLVMLGSAHSRAGRPAAAAHLRRAVAHYAELRDPIQLTVAESALAGHYLKTGMPELARPIVHRCLVAARRLHHPWCEATALRLTADLELLDGAAAAAVGHLTTAVAILRDIGQQVPLGRVLGRLGQAQLASGDPAEALQTGRAARAVLARLDPAEATAVDEWLVPLEDTSRAAE